MIHGAFARDKFFAGSSGGGSEATGWGESGSGFPAKAPPRVLLFSFSLVLAACGCSFGPMVLERSHGRYYEAVRRVNEEELLRSLVHIRYNESPFSLNVSSIAAQYELSGSAEARPFFGVPTSGIRSFSTVLPDFLASGANRPTITLLPGGDADAMRGFLTPIPNEFLLFLAHTSWPVSTIVRLWVERLNGVPNAVAASGPQRGVISDFVRFRRVAELLQLAQDRGLEFVRSEDRFKEIGAPMAAESITAAASVEAAKNGMEYRLTADGKSRVLVRRERGLVIEVNPGAERSPEMLELARLLNLVPGRRRYELFTGEVADPLLYPRAPSAEIRAQTRSTAEVYFYLANGVEAPVEHFTCGLVPPQADAEGRVFDVREVTRGLFEVHVCKARKPPATAYVAVKYRGYWYYIDDADQPTKTTFALMLQLRRLDFSRSQPVSGPFLTLPVGGR